MGTKSELEKRLNKSYSKADDNGGSGAPTYNNEEVPHYQREGETSTTSEETKSNPQTQQTQAENKSTQAIVKDPTKIATAKFKPMEQKYAMDGEMVDTYERMARATDPNRPLTPNEEEQLEKKQKREAIISLLGDSLTGLANIYFGSQGADVSGSTTSMSEKSRKRWDEIKAERDAKAEKYYNNIQRRREERIKREDANKLTPYERERLNIMREENEFNRQYKQAEADRKAKQDANNYTEKQRYNDARISFMEWKQSNGGKDDGKVVPFRISEDETLDIPSYEYNGVINALWGMMSKAEQDAVGTENPKTLQRQPATRNQIIAEVQRRAATDPAMQKFLRERAKKKSSATSPKSEEKPQAKKDKAYYDQYKSN